MLIFQSKSESERDYNISAGAGADTIVAATAANFAIGGFEKSDVLDLSALTDVNSDTFAEIKELAEKAGNGFYLELSDVTIRSGRRVAQRTDSGHVHPLRALTPTVARLSRDAMLDRRRVMPYNRVDGSRRGTRAHRRSGAPH